VRGGQVLFGTLSCPEAMKEPNKPVQINAACVPRKSGAVTAISRSACACLSAGVGQSMKSSSRILLLGLAVYPFFHRAMASSEFDLLVQQSEEELRLLTAAHDDAWHISEAAWHRDQDAGTLVFTSSDGIRATCSVQLIGTYNTDNGTWLWAWDHPAILAPLRVHAQKVREYGLRHDIPDLTTRKIACTKDEAWRFTAVACKLNGAQGAYCEPALPALVFMTFSEIHLSKVPEQKSDPAQPTD
jgi:hypothetical protein